MNPKKIIIALIIVVTAGVGLTFGGNLFKGSFDAFNTAKDFKIQTFTVTPGQQSASDIKDIQIAYTLEKKAHNLFMGIASPSKKQKFISLPPESFNQGQTTLNLPGVDMKDFFQEMGEYKITMIAYNDDNEITDMKTATIKTSQQVAKVGQKITTDIPSGVSIVSPESNAKIDVQQYKNDPSRLVIKWTDERNKTAGARQSNAAGYYQMNYRWKLVAGKLTSHEDVDKASGIPGATSDWEGNFPTYEAGGDTPSSSTDCIVSMKSDGKEALTPRWTCTTAIIPFTVLNSLAAGDYTIAIQAGDGISASNWNYKNIALLNTESAIKKGLEQQQNFLEAEKKSQEIMMAFAEENAELFKLSEAISVEEKKVEKGNGGDQLIATYRIYIDKTSEVFTNQNLILSIKVDGKNNSGRNLIVNDQTISQKAGPFAAPTSDSDGSTTIEVKINLDDGGWPNIAEKLKEHIVTFDFDYIDKDGTTKDLISHTRTVQPSLFQY